MPRLLIISRCPPYPLHLGDRLIVWHLARQLAARGYTLDLLALAQHTSDHHEIDHYRAYFEHIMLFDERPRHLWMYAQRALTGYFPQTLDRYWQPDLWRNVAQRLTQYAYDAVQLFGGVHVYEGASQLAEVPAIITPYESYSLYLERALAQDGGLVTRLSHWMAQHYERHMFTPYQQTVVLTERDRDALHALNPALPVTVIPNGIDLDYFDGGQCERESATLLFVGNYEYAPNQDAARLLAQEILPAVRAHIPQARLQLVGNAPDASLRALASDHVEITGRVADVRPYLRQATLFVSPLRVGAGIKNKILEALAMEIPVIASPVSMDGIAVVDGLHARVAALDEMTAGIVALLRDPQQRATLSANSRPLIVDHYSWAQVASRYEALYVIP